MSEHFSDSIYNLARSVGIFFSTTAPAIPLVLLPLATWWCRSKWERVGPPDEASWAVSTMAISVADGVLLAAPAYLGLSFGPLGLPWTVMILLRAGMARGGSWMARHLGSRGTRVLISALWLVNLALLAALVDALYVEPFRLQISYVQVPAPVASLHLRIVQLSDLHFERTTKRERAVLEIVRQLQPDLIVLTGDNLNTSYLDDPTAQQDARDFMKQLSAPYGVYAIAGTPTTDTPEALAAVLGGLPNITLLQDEVYRLDVRGRPVYLVGITNRKGRVDRPILQRVMQQVPADAPTILLYHTPDLIAEASAAGVDLYLAGHTHGGQVRLPWYGSVITSSAYGKRYDAGRFQVGPTTLYVSRGIGMEGRGMPRVRFLCPPEVVEIEWGE